MTDLVELEGTVTCDRGLPDQCAAFMNRSGRTPVWKCMREYIIEATEAGYQVFVITDGERYPMGDRPYPSLIRARDQIPKRYRSKARLVHHTAYTEMINTPAGTSPPLDLPIKPENY